jgi:hypothetical protein
VQLAFEASQRALAEHQRALILTFTVSAVDQIEQESLQQRKLRADALVRVEIANYHALYKRLLDAYVRYCGVPEAWRTWLPHEVESALAAVDEETQRAYQQHDRRKQWELSNATSIVAGLMDTTLKPSCSEPTLRAAHELLSRNYAQGLLHYDSWPYFAHRILSESKALSRRVGSRYPLVFVDEFQDTNGIEWAFIRELTCHSTLVCMTDIDQAIYFWRGADPKERLRRLLEERAPENKDGFELLEYPRTAHQPKLRELAAAIRDSCGSQPRSARFLQEMQDCFEVKGVTKRQAEPEGGCEGEWPKAYVAALKPEARKAARDGKRVAVLCPTWALLGGVSYWLNSKLGGVPLRHAIVGLEDEVGAFLSALVHALSERARVQSAQVALRETKAALERMRRVAVVRDHRKGWFAPSTHALTEANRKRRDRVCELLGNYVDNSSDLRQAARDLPALAKQIRGAMKSGRDYSTWLADGLLDTAVNQWYAAIGDFLRRNPDANAGDLLEAAWSAVEGCVAQQRRKVARTRILVMTAHAAKGKEVQYTFLCGASRGTRHVHAKDPAQCGEVRNLLHVACSRSRERVVVLHKKDEPCCVVSRLRGGLCPLTTTAHLARPSRRGEASEDSKTAG